LKLMMRGATDDARCRRGPAALPVDRAGFAKPPRPARKQSEAFTFLFAGRDPADAVTLPGHAEGFGFTLV
jgi:hypothetical protein